MTLEQRFEIRHGSVEIPEPDSAVESARAGSQETAIGRKGQGVHLALSRLQNGPLTRPAAGDVPQPDIAVDRAGGQSAAITRPGHGHDPSALHLPTVVFGGI